MSKGCGFGSRSGSKSHRDLDAAGGAVVVGVRVDPFGDGDRAVLAAQFLPVLALGAYGGLIADRAPKRPLLMGTQAALIAATPIPC